MEINGKHFGVAVRQYDGTGYVFCAVDGEIVWQSRCGDLLASYYDFVNELMTEFPIDFTTQQTTEKALWQMASELEKFMNEQAQQTKRITNLMYMNNN